MVPSVIAPILFVLAFIAFNNFNWQRFNPKPAGIRDNPKTIGLINSSLKESVKEYLRKELSSAPPFNRDLRGTRIFCSFATLGTVDSDKFIIGYIFTRCANFKSTSDWIGEFGSYIVLFIDPKSLKIVHSDRDSVGHPYSKFFPSDLLTNRFVGMDYNEDDKVLNREYEKEAKAYFKDN